MGQGLDDSHDLIVLLGPQNFHPGAALSKDLLHRREPCLAHPLSRDEDHRLAPDGGYCGPEHGVGSQDLDPLRSPPHHRPHRLGLEAGDVHQQASRPHPGGELLDYLCRLHYGDAEKDDVAICNLRHQVAGKPHPQAFGHLDPAARPPDRDEKAVILEVAGKPASRSAGPPHDQHPIFLQSRLRHRLRNLAHLRHLFLSSSLTACSMTSTGALLPVQISIDSAPCQTSIITPSRTFAPAFAASRKSSVSLL